MCSKKRNTPPSTELIESTSVVPTDIQRNGLVKRGSIFSVPAGGEQEMMFVLEDI
jgi:hypothetical protein